ncbi:MAG: orotidine-5'-phosphate decarboxylase [Candidatus Marinimicrobia bacterium]|nr:orotidine-5'-phosphate decarboxylase [Candidatus Neomarinimicrobiota bacterium]
MKTELIVALDVPTPDAIAPILAGLPAEIRWYKIGLELFCAAGPRALAPLQAAGKNIFLDLKLHDIPRTVARAVTAAAGHGVQLLTLHAAGGQAMLAAAATAARASAQPPRLIAITTLTSLAQSDFDDLGIARSLPEQAQALGRMAMNAGLDGVVTSVHEAAALRAALGPRALLVTPGIRLAGDAVGDQKRVATPAAARTAGANYIVVGRPILEAADPAAAARQILEACRA